MAASYLTPQQLAERWSCDETTVQKLCRTGELRAMRLGRAWRIAVAEVERFEDDATERACDEAMAAHAATEPVEMAPRAKQAWHRAAVELDGEYVPVVKGVVPWRSSVIEESASPAGRRGSAAQRETASR